MAICIYPQDCEDFSTNGLGLLTPTSCYAYGEDGHYTELELEQPIDDTYRWMQLVEGAIIKAPVPQRESPEYEDVTVVEPGEGTTVVRDVYKVDAKTKAKMYRSASTASRVVGSVKKDQMVVRLGSSGSFYKVSAVKGGRTGWMKASQLDYDHSKAEKVSAAKASGTVVRYEQAQEQLWRIYHVEPDTEKGLVKAKAQHVAYDLQHNIINANYNVEATQAASAIQGAWDRLMYDSGVELHIGAGLTAIVKGDYSFENPIEALLDPDEGMVGQAGALVVLDNWDLWVLPNAERDCGVTLRRGKNVKGIKAPLDISGVRPSPPRPRPGRS